MAPTLLRWMAAACLSSLASLAAAGSVQIQVLDKEGRAVPEAVVVLYPAQASATLQPQSVTIAQQRMRFVPLVTVVPPGSKVLFTNLDRWDHHIRGVSSSNPLSAAPPVTDFEMRLGGATGGKPGGTQEETLKEPGAVLLSCYLHSSMRGHIFVTDSAYTLKTDENGIARFEQVPEGAAKVRVWHPEQLLELPQRPVQIASAPLIDTVTLTVVPRRKR